MGTKTMPLQRKLHVLTETAAIFTHYRTKKINLGLTLNSIIFFKELLWIFQRLHLKIILMYFRIGKVRIEALHRPYIKEGMGN